MTAVRKELGRRRKPLGLVTAFVALTAVLVFAFAASSTIGDSDFEGNDGNLVVNTVANSDWDNAPNLETAQDLENSQTDNAFGQGAKENDVNITVVSGSIPNSKADLARFAVAGEVINGDTYMYLAWSRANQSGTVNFDIELNQLTQPDLTTAGAKVLNRAVDDALINYSFQGGSNTPTLTRYHWNGSVWVLDGAISSTCSEGATNSVTVPENLGGRPTVNRPAQQFGEASINLVCAGLVEPNECEPFSTAYIKSRASTSFNSEIKDFVAPIPITFSSCGKLTIIKHTNPGNIDQDFGYTSTGGLSPDTFTLNDAGVDTIVFDQLQPGMYTVTEDADPVGFAFASLDCVGTGGSESGRTATAVITGGSDIVCTYINDQQLGAVRVVKTRKHAADGSGDHPHAGVDFTIAGQSVETDANGMACVDGLPLGSYDATEDLPAGYHADQELTQSATVDNNASCDDDPYVGEELDFGNTPLTDVTISVDSQVPGGTDTQVDCDNDALDFDTDATGDDSATASDQEPQEIHCTITIDP
jgi:hypothetical protein